MDPGSGSGMRFVAGSGLIKCGSETLPVPHLIRGGHKHIGIFIYIFFFLPQSQLCNLKDAPLLYNCISATFERNIFSNCTFANSIFLSDLQLQVRNFLKCCSETVYPQFRIIYSEVCNGTFETWEWHLRFFLLWTAVRATVIFKSLNSEAYR